MDYLLPFPSFNDLSHMPSSHLPIVMQIDLQLLFYALGFCESSKTPEVVMRIMLDTAVDAFAKCSVSCNVWIVHVQDI